MVKPEIKMPQGKPNVRDIKKTIRTHLGEALRATEVLVEKTDNYENLYTGLERLIHNMKI